MKNNNTKNGTKGITASASRAYPDYDSFAVVGDNLVNGDFMRALEYEIDGKISLFQDVISIPDLLGDFYDTMGQSEREVVGACIVELINTKRVELHPDSMS